MSVQRIELKNFNQHLIFNPPTDSTPLTALRRARGIHPVKTGSIRSRYGCANIYSLASVHSLCRFNDARFQAASTIFYRNNVSIKTGLNGNRLTFVKMSPTPGKPDYLFVCGGGTLFKVSPYTTTFYTANGSFETAGAGPPVFASWTEQVGDGAIARSTDRVHDQTYGAKLTSGATSNTYIAQTYTITETSGTVKIEFYTCTSDGLTPGRYGIYDVTHSAYITAVTSTGVRVKNFQKVSLSFSIPSGMAFFRLELWCPASNTKIAYFDDVRTYVLGDGAKVSNWGISPPADGFTVTSNSQLSKTIELFEDHTTWTHTGLSKANEATLKQQGTNSLKLTLKAGAKGSVVKASTLDLSLFSVAGDSSDEDYIAFQFYAENVENIQWLEVQFSLNDTTFNNAFSRRTEQHSDKGRGKKKREKGIAVLEDASEAPLERLYVLANDRAQEITDYGRPENYHDVNDAVSDPTLPLEEASWKQVRLPKGSFTRQGSTSYDWDDVKALRIIIKATTDVSGVIAYLDDMRMIGGTGIQGTYKHRVTYLNSISGHRSNANPTPVITEDLVRQSVAIASLSASSDTQVDRVELWRTVGNGSVCFKAVDQDDTITTRTDNFADVWAMDTRETAEYLSSTELPLDNDIPESDFSFACGPHNASCFWLSSGSGEKGRVYYSPVGRPESVDGFLSITGDDEPMQALVTYNGFLYAFSNARVFQILGTNPYVSREVFKVPGTEAPFTVVATPKGILYRAPDGVRLFNGAFSQLAGFDSIGKIFRGEAVENLTSFVGTVAAYAKNEYVISDTSQTLALNLDDMTWRDLGVGFTALYFEDDGQIFTGALTSNVVSVEPPGTYEDAGTDLAFAIDTTHLTLPGDLLAEICNVEVHANTGNEVLACSIICDDSVISLGNVQSSTRTITTFNVNKQARRFALRLTGTIDAQVEVFKIVFEVKEVYKRR